jgi:hypothetical protein
MATKEEIKRYIAQWMDLGNKVSTPVGNLFVSKVYDHKTYSEEFNKLWLYLWNRKERCRMEYTSQTIEELERRWFLSRCGECKMEVMLITCPSINARNTIPDLGQCPGSELCLHRKAEKEKVKVKDLNRLEDELTNFLEWDEDGDEDEECGITTAINRMFI